MPNQKIVDLLANKLREGITHPGDPAREIPPRVIQLPVFRTVGLPKEVADQVDATVKLLAEAVVHTIEVDGEGEIAPKVELANMRANADNARADLRMVAVHCRCDGRREDPLVMLTVTNESQVVVDGKQILGALVTRSVECPHGRVS